MIDEYVYAQRRRKFWRTVFSDSRIAIATLTAFALVVLQLVAIVLSIRYHGG